MKIKIFNLFVAISCMYVSGQAQAQGEAEKYVSKLRARFSPFPSTIPDEVETEIPYAESVGEEEPSPVEIVPVVPKAKKKRKKDFSSSAIIERKSHFVRPKTPKKLVTSSCPILPPLGKVAGS